MSEALHADADTSRRTWSRVTRAWQTAFCVSLGLAALVARGDAAPWFVYAALAAMAASFTWVLMPLLADDRPHERWRLAGHLTVVAVGCYVAILADGHISFVASVVLSQFIPCLRLGLSGVGILAVAALVLTLPVAIRERFGEGAQVSWLISALSAWAVNLFIGSFTGELIHGFERRGTLLRQLEETRAELDRAQHEAGVREERERLAREIHDTLAQGFTSLLMLVQAAEATLDTDPAATRERLALAEQTARENLAEARALISSEPGADLSLDAAIRRVAERIGREAGIGARVTIGGTARPLSADVQVVTLRVAQEALANVGKHARATDVTVRLDYAPDGMRLVVEDDGVGIGRSTGAEPSIPAAEGGFGLRSMRDRVEQIGGAFDVGPGAAGIGTRVTAEVPYA